MPHIMIVDADRAFALPLAETLQAGGYSSEIIVDGQEADARIVEMNPDLVLLDLPLPGLSGLQLCGRIRDRSPTRNLPIVIMTALSEEADRLHGFAAGADDYVVKPFSTRELVARIGAILRRRDAAFTSTIDSLSVGEFVLERVARRARRAGRDLKLGPTDFALLEYMMERQGCVISRAQFIEGVWGSSVKITPRAIDVNIGRLRKLLSHEGERDPVATVFNEGYRFLSIER